MTPQEMKPIILKRFKKRGLKEEHLTINGDYIKIKLDEWHIRIDTHYRWSRGTKVIHLSGSHGVYGRDTSYKGYTAAFYRRISNGITKIENLYEKKILKEEADRQKVRELENALGPYKEEYGDLFEVDGLQPKLIIGDSKVPVDIKRDKVHLMDNGYQRFSIPLHLFVPMVKEMELERIIGAS